MEIKSQKYVYYYLNVVVWSLVHASTGEIRTKLCGNVISILKSLGQVVL